MTKRIKLKVLRLQLLR